MPQAVRKAVFPAAGLGTRFLPATKASPKEMLPLVDKPLIQYVVEEAVASGIESIIIVTGWVTYLKNNPSDFRTMVNGFVNSIEYRLRFGPA
jgi:UTP-glucose-1-phosphate uridylyltransferase